MNQVVLAKLAQCFVGDAAVMQMVVHRVVDNVSEGEAGMNRISELAERGDE